MPLPSDREVDQAIPEREPSARTGHVISRIGIPLALAVVGVILLIVGVTLFGILALLAAVIAFVADRIIRLGIVSQRDRDREAAARQSMRRSGRWNR
ncbi:MAG: hypothetical protein WC558_03735 [Patulibacter sp.]